MTRGNVETTEPDSAWRRWKERWERATTLSRTPLAWRNLTHEGRRLATAAAGIGFAVLLMCMQIGFYNALLDSTVALPRILNCDLVMMSGGRFNMTLLERFPKTRLTQAAAFPGVASAVPLYTETALSEWKNPVNGRRQGIRSIGFPLDAPTFTDPDVQRLLPRLAHPQHVLSDLRSKPDFGFPADPVGMTAELAGRQVRVVGAFTMGSDFANDGNLLMSDRTFAVFFGPRGSGLARLNHVDLGLIKLTPEARADWPAVRVRLEQSLPNDVRILTRDELIAQERSFWLKATPIGFVFQLGTLMGFLVGMIICYQILYAEVDDHLREFATLKAMGYRNFYFVGVVLQESVLLSVIGFLPGVVASIWLYDRLALSTGLLMNLTLERALFVFSLTLLMCVLSGVLAMRRLAALDPADLF